EIASDLDAGVFLLRERGLGPAQWKEGTNLDAGSSLRSRSGRASGARKDQPDGGELPKSHQMDSRSGAVLRPFGLTAIAGVFASACARPSGSPLGGGCPGAAASAANASPTIA